MVNRWLFVVNRWKYWCKSFVWGWKAMGHLWLIRIWAQSKFIPVLTMSVVSIRSSYNPNSSENEWWRHQITWNVTKLTILPLFGLNNCDINPKNLLSVIKFICLLFKIDFKVINPVFISTQIGLWWNYQNIAFSAFSQYLQILLMTS